MNATLPKPLLERGDYRVLRFCCTSGLCCGCHNRGNHGHLDKRERIVHTGNVSKAWADMVAANWSQYGATVEKVP